MPVRACSLQASRGALDRAVGNKEPMSGRAYRKLFSKQHHLQRNPLSTGFQA